MIKISKRAVTDKNDSDPLWLHVFGKEIMRKAIVISKEEWVCPICGKFHFIEERCRRAETVIKGQSVCYDQKYYFCSNASEDENEYE